MFYDHSSKMEAWQRKVIAEAVTNLTPVYCLYDRSDDLRNKYTYFKVFDHYYKQAEPVAMGNLW